MKTVALISADPTVNFIRDGKVVDKFVYLLCKNDNCVTRVINEDVPQKFYNDNDVIRCRYCRRPYKITNNKVSVGEMFNYKASLPKSIERI